MPNGIAYRMTHRCKLCVVRSSLCTDDGSNKSIDSRDTHGTN